MAVLMLSDAQVERLRAAIATCSFRDWLFAVTAEAGLGTLSLLVGRPGVGETIFTDHEIPADVLSRDSDDEYAGLSAFVEGVVIQLVLRDVRRYLMVGGKSVLEREQEIVNLLTELPSYAAASSPVAPAREGASGDDLLSDVCPCAALGTSAVCVCPDPVACGCSVAVARSVEA